MNKKLYDSKIWQYNISYTNIIRIKDIIILEKNREREKLLGGITNKTTLVKVIPILSFNNLDRKYKCAIDSNIDLDLEASSDLD